MPVHGAHDDAVSEALLPQRLCTHQTRRTCRERPRGVKGGGGETEVGGGEAA